MSVDQRIREGLTMIDQQLPPSDTESAYEFVEHGARRRTLRDRAVVVAGAAAAAVVVGVALVQANEPSAVPVPADRPSQVPSAGPSDATNVQEPPDSPIEGVWRSRSIAFADMADTLRDAGKGRWVDELRDELGDFGRIQMTLRLQDGRSQLRLPGTDGWLDEQDYELSTDRITLHTIDGLRRETTYTPDLSPGWVMKLVFDGTTEGRTDGIPGEVWQRALYTSVDFEKVLD